MTEEILSFVFEVAAECLSSEIIPKILGGIGVFTALVFTWGRADWRMEECRSIILGTVVTVVGLAVAAGSLM